MAVTRGSPDDDGYKHFTEDINNVTYGSAITSKSQFSNHKQDYDSPYHCFINKHESKYPHDLSLFICYIPQKDPYLFESVLTSFLVSCVS